MSSTYSQNLKLELIGDGEQSGIWGDTTNYNLGTLLEQAITGVQPITVGGFDVPLTNFPGLSNQARNAVLYVTGSPGAVRIIYLPANQSKTYIIYNGVDNGYSLEVRVTGQASGVTIPNGTTILMYTNGTQCFLVSPSTAPTPTVGTFTGYVIGTQLYVTSGTVLKDQVIYNPGFITVGNPNGYATVSLGTSNPYTLTYTGTTVNIGDATYRPNQPFVAVTTPTQLATLDYIQNKTQSVYLGGTPTAPTATAATFEGYIPTGTAVLVVTFVYPGSGGPSVGQFINGTNITSGSYVQANGTGSSVASVFSGYISAGAGLSTPGTTLTITGISSGTPTLGQYLDGGSTVLGTTLASGGGVTPLSWGVSGAAQLVGGPGNSVVFRGLGAGSGSTGWYTLNTASSNVNITPIVAFSQQAQLVNMSLLSNISFLVGSLGTQDYNTVNITGGTINGVTITGSNIATNSGGTGLTSLTPNSVLIAGSTSTSAVNPVRPSTLGNVLSSTAGATITVSSATMVLGVQYTIVSLGTTTTQANWNTIAGTSGLTYVVGSVFTCANIGTGLGDGTIATTNWTSTPATIAAGAVGPTQLSGQQTGSFPVYGVRAFAYIDWNRGTVAANALVTGQTYVIQDSGTSVNWIAMGSSSTAFGTVFTKNSTTYSGTGGTAYNLVSKGFSQIYYSASNYIVRFTFEGGSYPSQHQYAITATAGDNGAQRYAAQYNRDATGFQLSTSDDASYNSVTQLNVMVIY
jgi:hypothetical protein